MILHISFTSKQNSSNKWLFIAKFQLWSLQLVAMNDYSVIKHRHRLCTCDKPSHETFPSSSSSRSAKRDTRSLTDFESTYINKCTVSLTLSDHTKHMIMPIHKSFMYTRTTNTFTLNCLQTKNRVLNECNVCHFAIINNKLHSNVTIHRETAWTRPINPSHHPLIHITITIVIKAVSVALMQTAH